MEQGPTERTIIEQCVKENMPLPERIQNAPDLVMGLGLYYGAFLDLTSCRGMGYGTEGPIPWTATIQWAREHELDEEQREELLHHIPQMDEVYLKFKAKKMAAAQKKPAQPTGRRR